MTVDVGAFDNERWSLAIFSAREDPHRLRQALAAAAHAERGGAILTIDLLVNGNAPLAEAMRRWLASAAGWPTGTSIRLWSVPQPDKAHTWNHYVHALMPLADIAYFIDGYVILEREALLKMAEALRRRPQALAATCVPSAGRSAPEQRRQLLAEGGLHGNFYAITGDTTDRLRRARFRLPIGIYRNDSALGAALAFNLDPAAHAWRPDRIAVVPEARYSAPVANPLRLSDLRTVLRRRLRQAQGHLETRALQAHLAGARRPPGAWPASSRGLVLQWAAMHPGEARALAWTDPLAWAALQLLRRRGESPLPAGAVECLGRYAGRVAARATTLQVSET